MKTIVTHIENVNFDDDGKAIYNENGEIQLKNADDIGILIKTHVVPHQQIENGTIITGLSTLSEVIWEEKRTPAPALVSPNDLFWLSIENEYEAALASDETEDEDVFSDDAEYFEDVELQN